MNRCDSCKHSNLDSFDDPCNDCGIYEEWEPKEPEEAKEVRDPVLVKSDVMDLLNMARDSNCQYETISRLEEAFDLVIDYIEERTK